MPFGLWNASGTFQSTMDVILSAIKWQFALAYLDSIVVFSDSAKEDIVHVRDVLTLLNNTGNTLEL